MEKKIMKKTVVEQGILEGLPAADPRITVFKGVPFAKPPVGKLRWAPPQDPDKWEGVRQAFDFAPIPPQPAPAERPNDDDLYGKEWAVDAGIQVNEDCLYLNVWSPAKFYKDKVEADKKYPVYFWIFGGGWQCGHSAEMEFDGERIARRGIVVVTINYRVNLFGFLSHPEITKEYPGRAANFGLQDQRKALEWVYKNISAFGGDPENITIGGQSAGGGSVVYQMLYEQKPKLIKRSIVESGMFINPFMGMFPRHTLKDAEDLGVKFFEFCGVKTLAEARELSTDFLRQKWSDWGGWATSAQTWGPIEDGVFNKGDLYDRLKTGEIEFPPIMTGFTTDEFNAGPKGCKEDEIISTVELGIRKMHLLEEANGFKNKNYFYKFDVPIPGWDNAGKFHSVDLWFFFESLAKCWRPFKGVHYDMARQICNYLCNFVKTGNPNGKDAFNDFPYSKESDYDELPKWDTYSTEKPNVMVFTEKCECKDYPASDNLKKYL